MTHQIGRHLVQAEKDLMVYIIRGALSAPELHKGLALLGPLIAEHGTCYLISDLREMGVLDAATRRVAATNPHLKHIRAYAGISSSMVQRTVATMALRAMTVFQGGGPRIAFFDTESAARIWIDEQRGAPGSSISE